MPQQYRRAVFGLFVVMDQFFIITKKI